ncbi:MFS transporter [Lignipirellula cremea]|uniref:Muropeptide transporter n=1 Tax=Lignipirellula cremea TaxID=2528010 RepID=A0A518DX23_9BACT|nr:MFS transporter [Lignipirellula cremea]QDU96388.1 muropeptide transporter [Lignipirellula cremea]
MDFLATPARRKVLFAALYFSEGAPIGFIWLALPTRLRHTGVPIEEITWLTAAAVIPWTFKFAWAPLVDLLRTRFWTLRCWVIAAQCLMLAAMAPLLWLDLEQHFSLIAACILCHAWAAATQDVAIDALCIATTDPIERGRLNGVMQTGMLLGRALLGGGALVLAGVLGETGVVALLLAAIGLPMCLAAMSQIPEEEKVPDKRLGPRAAHVLAAMRTALCRRNTWLGLAFALFGGAAFKSLEVVLGPFLHDRGYSKQEIGWFAAGPMILMMIVGSLLGGWLADRMGKRRLTAAALGLMVLTIAALAGSDLAANNGVARLPAKAEATEATAEETSVPSTAEQPAEEPKLKGGRHLLVILSLVALGIGLLTAASYAMFMDLTQRSIAATQFSAFMGATNGCESWSSFAIGQMIVAYGYPWAMLAMCGVSAASVPLLLFMRTEEEEPALASSATSLDDHDEARRMPQDGFD